MNIGEAQLIIAIHNIQKDDFLKAQVKTIIDLLKSAIDVGDIVGEQQLFQRLEAIVNSEPVGEQTLRMADEVIERFKARSEQQRNTCKDKTERGQMSKLRSKS